MTQLATRAVRPTAAISQQPKPAAQFGCLDGSAAEWIFKELLPNPSAFAVLGFFICIAARHGRLNKANWIRVTRRELEAACRISSSTVLKALDYLLKGGYLVRNKQDCTLYRLPANVFRIGPQGAKVKTADDRLPLPKEVIAVEFPVCTAPRRRRRVDIVSTETPAQDA